MSGKNGVVLRRLRSQLGSLREGLLSHRYLYFRIFEDSQSGRFAVGLLL